MGDRRPSRTGDPLVHYPRSPISTGPPMDMVVGAVIGGDAGTIVMIGGGVVGIIGLWRYLQ